MSDSQQTPASLEVIVCAGGGGVGKTTSAAALALSLARTGRRVLVVAIDPALRLADAMGVKVGGHAQQVDLPGSGDRLFVLMPNPRDAMRLFVEHLFADEPEALERLLKNRLYQMLEEAVPGIHELVCMSHVVRASQGSDIDTVVIDTAPSRHAIDFVTYPRRLGKLLGGRTIAWLGNMARNSQSETDASERRWLAWGRRRAERALARVLGESAVADVSGLFSEMMLAREPFVELSNLASEMLLSKSTRYLLVAAPHGVAGDDVRFLLAQLKHLHLAPRALLVNGGRRKPPDWQALVDAADLIPIALNEEVQQLHAENLARWAAADKLSAAFTRDHHRLAQIALPFVENSEPREIVIALADALEGQLSSIVDLSS